MTPDQMGALFIEQGGMLNKGSYGPVQQQGPGGNPEEILRQRLAMLMGGGQAGAGAAGPSPAASLYGGGQPQQSSFVANNTAMGNSWANPGATRDPAWYRMMDERMSRGSVNSGRIDYSAMSGSTMDTQRKARENEISNWYSQQQAAPATQPGAAPSQPSPAQQLYGGPNGDSLGMRQSSGSGAAGPSNPARNPYAAGVQSQYPDPNQWRYDDWTSGKPAQRTVMASSPWRG